MTRLTRRFSTLEEKSAVLEEALQVADEAAKRVGRTVDEFSFGIRMVLEEAWVNHLKHGHGFDPELAVECEIFIEDQEEGTSVVFDSKDQGQGFRVEDVPDCTDAEQIEKPCGRGTLIINGCSESIGARVEYLEGGTRFRMTLVLAREPERQNAA